MLFSMKTLSLIFNKRKRENLIEMMMNSFLIRDENKSISSSKFFFVFLCKLT